MRPTSVSSGKAVTPLMTRPVMKSQVTKRILRRRICSRFIIGSCTDCGSLKNFLPQKEQPRREQQYRDEQDEAEIQEDVTKAQQGRDLPTGAHGAHGPVQDRREFTKTGGTGERVKNRNKNRPAEQIFRRKKFRRPKTGGKPFLVGIHRRASPVAFCQT